MSMIPRYVGQVKLEKFTLYLRGAGIQILPPIRPGLLRYLQDRQKRPDISGKPRLVDLQVVMSNADSNPAAPSERTSHGQLRLLSIAKRGNAPVRLREGFPLAIICLHISAQVESSH